MKTIRRVLVLLLCLASVASAFASTVYAVNTSNAESEIICFDLSEDVKLNVEKRDLNEEQIQMIIDHFSGAEERQATARNIICSIFGHDYKVTTASTVTHNVYSTQPKCEQRYYNVSICNRCDHTESVLTRSTRIVCCP